MRCVIAVLALLVIVAAAKPAYHQFHHKVQLKAEALPAGANYNVTSTAVAGLSAGAFLAVQYHFAYSADLVGAGIIAGGPFYCAQGSLINAELQCMNAVEAISVPTLQAAASACADGKVCDDLGNLKNQNVYLFSGTFDSVVKQSVMKAAADFYSSYLTSSSQLNTTFSYPAQHSWPTDNYGNACYSLGSPYINNCGYDSSYAMLSHIFGALNAPTTAPSSNVKSLDQSKFTPDGASPSSISLGNNAYVYVPTGCQNGQACRLVIALHGCQQTIDDIGFTFVTNTGLNEVGEANNIIILYPQAIKAILMSNPNGCFDWWGYTGSNYANQKGPQMATIHNMANSLSGLF